MKRIILYVNNEIIKKYKKERKEDIFKVVTDSFVNELGEEKIMSAYAEAENLTVDVVCESDNEDIRNFIYDSMDLNDDDACDTEISIFNVSDDDSITYSKQLEIEGNRERFVNGVELFYELRDELNKKIIGQAHAVNEIASGLFNASIKTPSDSVLASFTLMGPSGSGKSLLARAVMEFLNDRVGTSYKAFGEADYEKDSCVSDILSFVSKNPKCVLFFDDIESIDKYIVTVIVSAFETGEYDDVSFRDTIMIFATKSGEGIYNSSFTGNFANVSEETLKEALSNDGRYTYLIKYQCNGKLIMLNFASPQILRDYAKNEIERRINELAEKTNVKIKCKSTELATAVLYMNKHEYSISAINDSVKRLFERELADLFMQIDRRTGRPLLSTANKIKLELSFDDATEKVKNLFSDRELTALVICDEKQAMTFNRIKNKLKNVKLVYASSYDSAVQSIREGVDFILLDVLLGVEDMKKVPTGLDDFKSIGIDVYEYIETYFREIPTYLISDVDYGVPNQAYACFLNSVARDLIFVKSNKTTALEQSIKEIQEGIELARDVAWLISEKYYLTSKTRQFVSDDGKTVTVKLDSLCLENVQRDIKSRYLTSFLASARFSDVIGHEIPKRIFAKYASFLTMKKAQEPPKGLLAYGPSGVGKKLLAKALAGETNATFISYDADELCYEEKTVGNVIDRINLIFNQAKQSAPSVLFIENIESLIIESKEEVVRAFFNGMGMLNQDKKRPVVLIASTRHGNEYFEDVIDNFDRAVGFFYPNKEERREFIKRYLASCKVNTISEQGIDTFTVYTYGNTYMGIKTIIDFAISTANGIPLTDSALMNANDLYEMGEETGGIDEQTYLRVAYHEMGHYLIDYLHGNRPSYVTIVARGEYGGYTMIGNDEEKGPGKTKKDYLDRICTGFGGRAAEVLIFGEKGINTGIGSDIREANWDAKRIVCRYGMGKKLSNIEALGIEEPTADMLKEIEEILQEQYERALRLLGENRGLLEALTMELVKKKMLTDYECEKIIAEYNEGKK